MCAEDGYADPMSESMSQQDPQTHISADPETVQLQDLDAVRSDGGASVPPSKGDVESDPSTDPSHEGGASGQDDPQAENAGTSLDQPSDDVSR